MAPILPYSPTAQIRISRKKKKKKQRDVSDNTQNYLGQIQTIGVSYRRTVRRATSVAGMDPVVASSQIFSWKISKDQALPLSFTNSIPDAVNTDTFQKLSGSAGLIGE